MLATAARVRPADGNVATMRLDDKGRIIEVADEVAAMLGTTAPRLLGQSLGDLAAERWRTLADNATARILVGYGRSFQLLLKGSRGRNVLLEMTPRPVRHEGRWTYLLSWSEPAGRADASTGFDAPELRRLANGLLRRREVELKQVVARLDDDIAPLIVVSKFMIEDALRRLGAPEDGSAELLRQARDRLRQSLGELDRISRALRPRMIDDLGLVPTLEWFCRDFEQSHPDVRVERDIRADEADIPRSLKLPIFRVVEEALANVERHAKASSVELALLRAGDELLLSVADNGEGFEAGATDTPAAWLHGIGLASIRKRVEASYGRLVLRSAPGQGTRIRAAWLVPARRMVEAPRAV